MLGNQKSEPSHTSPTATLSLLSTHLLLLPLLIVILPLLIVILLILLILQTEDSKERKVGHTGEGRRWLHTYW